MPYSPQFVQEIDKQGSRIHLSQANLAWSDFSSLKRDLGREHRWISLPVRFQLASEKGYLAYARSFRLSEIYAENNIGTSLLSRFHFSHENTTSRLKRLQLA